MALACEPAPIGAVVRNRRSVSWPSHVSAVCRLARFARSARLWVGTFARFVCACPACASGARCCPACAAVAPPPAVL